MTPERWRQIEALFHQVVDLPAGDRRVLLDQADSEVRREVESMLAADGSLPERPAPEGETETIAAGARLGPYQLERLIGSGGMGQVFRARDTRLNRAVAIKISAEGFGERFEREARSIAQLNHPCICTLYDVGPNYLVMELIEGETLTARLQGGPLPLEQVFKYGGQIADALAAAHSKGIVHRDLKPGNIMTTKASAKVLDFGIAKSAQDETLTASRVVIGTPAYMSPEQREGKACDARSDIYALGLVLREMATGSRSGDLAGTPAHFAHVVSRCLEPDPADRWQAASDVSKELEWAAALKPPEPHQTPPSFSGRLPWSIAAIACLGLLVAGTAWYRQRPLRDPGSSEFILALTQPTEEVDGVPVPSPDGRLMAFLRKDLQGVTSIWIRPLDSVEVRRLPGTEGSTGDLAWSSEGAWIAFFTGGKLKKIRPEGGPPETIAAIPGFQDGAWGSRGDIVFRSTNRAALSRVRDTGGAVRPLTTLNAALTENSHRYPTFLPDGRHFLYVGRCSDRANNALYLASVDSPEVKRVMPAEARVSYIPGAILYYRDGAIVAQHFDTDRAQLSGDPVPVFAGVAYNAPSLQASFRASLGGTLFTAMLADAAAGAKMQWYTRNGDEAGTLTSGSGLSQPRISPDGSRVAFERPDPQTGNRDIWSIEIARGITSRLTTHVANDWFPVWAPDGRRMLLGSDRDGGANFRTYLKTSMDPGSGESSFGTVPDSPNDWSKDGQWISFGSNDIFIAPASRPESPFVFLGTSAVESDARFSPDSKWIAYSSNESGRSEIYVRPFAGGPASPTGKIQISDRGGEYPVWDPSGQAIYYMSGNSAIYVADTLGLGRGVAIPPPVRLFQACPETGALGSPLSGSAYDYAFDTHDGKKFLVVCRAQPRGRFTVLTNWKFPG